MPIFAITTVMGASYYRHRSYLIQRYRQHRGAIRQSDIRCGRKRQNVNDHDSIAKRPESEPSPSSPHSHRSVAAIFPSVVGQA